MQQYLNLLEDILVNGERRQNRTGIDTIEVFDRHLCFDMSEGFPLLTTKKLHVKSILYELLFFVNGMTDNKWLLDHGCTIWQEWQKPNGDLGPIYGYQWRHWQTVDSLGRSIEVDQLAELIDKLKNHPNDRRQIVTAWHPGQIKDMALPPCHWSFSTYVTNNGHLNLKWHQRSVDTFLGLPFNIASYAFLLHMLCKLTGLKPGKLYADLDCVHLYINHLKQARTQLSRTPVALPTLTIVGEQSKIEDFKYKDFIINDYNPMPGIKADVAV